MPYFDRFDICEALRASNLPGRLAASIGDLTMPYTPEYFARMRAVHDRINATRATTTTPHGRRWMRIMNRLRTRLAYALPRYGFAHG